MSTTREGPSCDESEEAAALYADTAPMPSDRLLLPVGKVIGGTYRIERLVGRGGMGAVYEATHRTLRRKFAVKVVLASDASDAHAAHRLVQEARTASSIRHDHIIDVTDLGHTEEGFVYVVMELLEGEDLSQRLERQAREPTPWLPDDEARRLFDEVLRGLAAAHDAGVVHRDLKPANIYLSRRGKSVVAKILDFGMSKITQSQGHDVRLTRTGQLIGTPLYMSPEQSRGAPVDHRADLYSLGVIMFEALAGELPFPATSVYECVLRHTTEPPPPLAARRPDLPATVASLVARCLEKSPGKRWASADELREAWRSAWDVDAERCVTDSDTAPFFDPAPRASSPPDTEALPPVRARRHANRWLAALGVLGVLSALGFVSVREPGDLPRAPAALGSRPPSDATQPTHALGALEAVQVLGAPGSEGDPAETPGSEGDLAETPGSEGDLAGTRSGPSDDDLPERSSSTDGERRIQLVSTPPGADVIVDGEVVGRTPHTLTLDSERGPTRIRFERLGHRAVRHTIDPNGPRRVHVRLAPSRATHRPLPDLAPSQYQR
ncbi:MAG: protein kinase [Myxococcales bacterium]|nr:protein kinase [Myxococcales bacterium]